MNIILGKAQMLLGNPQKEVKNNHNDIWWVFNFSIFYGFFMSGMGT